MQNQRPKYIERLANLVNQVHQYVDSTDKEEVEKLPVVTRHDQKFYVLDFHMYLGTNDLVYIELLEVEKLEEWRNWWEQDYTDPLKHLSEEDVPYEKEYFYRLDKGEEAATVFVLLREIFAQHEPPVVIQDDIFKED